MTPISHKQWVWLGPGDLPGCGTHLDIAIEEWRSTTWGPIYEPQEPRRLANGLSFTEGHHGLGSHTSKSSRKQKGRQQGKARGRLNSYGEPLAKVGG